MKNVVLFGDSIRLWGYGKVIDKYLPSSEYHIFQPEDNSRFAKYLLRMVFECKEELKNADIVHFNVGLWDCTYLFDDGKTFTALDEYVNEVSRVVDIIKSYCPNIVFSLTTPVWQENPYHKIETIELFNKTIKEVLENKGVYVNDLYSLIAKDVKGNIREDDMIHLTDKGMDIAAKNIAKVIIDRTK